MGRREYLVSTFRISSKREEILDITLLNDNDEQIGVFYSRNWSFLTAEQVQELKNSRWTNITISRKEMETLAHEIIDDEDQFTIVFNNGENFHFISLDKGYPYFKGINNIVCKYWPVLPEVYVLEFADGQKMLYNIRNTEHLCFHFDSIKPSSDDLECSSIVATIPIHAIDDENGMVNYSYSKEGNGIINENITLLINEYSMGVIQAYSRLQQRYLVKNFEEGFDSVMSTNCIEYIRRLLYLNTLGYLKPREDITEEECDRVNKENEEKAVAYMLKNN